MKRSHSCVCARLMGLTAAAFWLGLGCGGGSDGATFVLKGSVEKGPYVLGSTVQISPVSSAGDPTGSVFTTQTSNDLGEFSTSVTGGPALSITGSGFYYNEVAGRLSNATLTLRAYYESSGAADEHANLNTVTHLAYDRVKTLASGGMAFPDAIAEAETELRAALHLVPPGFDPGVAGSGMSVAGGDVDGNAYLLAVSSLFAEAAELRVGPDGPIDATLQEVMNAAALDLSDDGALSAQLTDELAVARRRLDPAQIMSDLGKRLMATGSSATVPDLDRVLDQDQDGQVNADDCRPLDPMRWSGHADLDNDGQDHVDCGGTDCDDDCPTCKSGGTAVCGDARDHDCDGVIDDLEGCGSCAPNSPTIVDGPVDTGTLQSLFVRGSYAYATGTNGLQVLDVSDPTAVAKVGSPLLGQARVAMARGSELVVSADGNGSGPGLHIYDLSDPSAPSQTAKIQQPVMLDNLWVTSSGLALGTHFGVYIFDVSDPNGPYQDGMASIDAHQVVAGNGYAYATGDGRKFQVISLANPRAPEAVHEETGSARQLVLRGDRLLVATSKGIEVWDVTTPASPSLVATVPVTPYGVNQMVVAGDWVYVDGQTSIDSIDISTPTAPTSGPSISMGFYPYPMSVVGSDLYVAGANGEGLYVVDLGCP